MLSDKRLEQIRETLSAERSELCRDNEYHDGVADGAKPYMDLAESLLDEIDRLRTALREREPQPIETAPRDGTRILLHRFEGDILRWSHSGDWSQISVRWFFDGATEFLDAATHWSPLPALKTKEAERDE